LTNSYQDISKADCDRISNKIRDDVYKPAFSFKTTVFLCGADITQKDKIRFKIADALQRWIWADIIYPEDIFDELLY